jgi:hypothetical protein
MTVQTPRQRFEALIVQGAADPMTVFEVGIPMRDGIELAADIYLPVTAAQPAPAIVQIYDAAAHPSRLKFPVARGSVSGLV